MKIKLEVKLISGSTLEYKDRIFNSDFSVVIEVEIPSLLTYALLPLIHNKNVLSFNIIKIE